MTTTLKSVVGCDNLELQEAFQGTCFGHAMSKACQYGTNDGNVCSVLREVSIKAVQADFQKCITWPKFGKGRQEWTMACMDSGL